MDYQMELNSADKGINNQPTNNQATPGAFSTEGRQQLRARAFRANLTELKFSYGAGSFSGGFSWTEGICRKIARAIARDKAKPQPAEMPIVESEAPAQAESEVISDSF